MNTLRTYAFYLFLAIAISSALFFRAVHPSADPFSDTFIDTQDEGLHSYAARNYYLKGVWTVDSLNYGVIMPVYPRVQVIGLYLFGFHNYAFRFASIVMAAASVLILGLHLYKEWGVLSAVAASTYMALHHFLIGISRSALPESTMIFLSIATFFLWHRTLHAKQNHYIWGTASGIAAAAMFLTKQSSAPVIGMMAVSLMYSFAITREKRNYVHILAGLMSAAAMVTVLYIVCVYAPNSTIWMTNYRATVGGNRPRKALIVPSYLASQIMDTVHSPFWAYVPVLGLLSGVAVIQYTRHWRRLQNAPKVTMEMLALCWLGIFLIYMVSVPDRYARFLIVSVPPMIILASSLLRRKGLLAAVVAALIIVDVLWNVYVNVKTVVMRPTYKYKEAAEELRNIVGNHKGIYPIHWIINEPFDAMSTYTAEIGDTQFRDYFDTYGWPEYVSLTDAQIDDFRKRAPLYFSHLTRIKRIQNYTVFKLIQY